MAEKLGVYICGGCDIGANLDVDALAEFAQNGKHSAVVKVSKANPVLCSPEGRAAIEADIAEHELDGVVCCACSPRVKWDVFGFGKTQVERVNLREHCVWSFQDDKKMPGQMEVIAKDYINMGISKLTKSNVPDPELPETVKTILVMGGGFTGLNAAKNAAGLGYDVVLVEKADNLGGKAVNFRKSFPLAYPYDQTQETGLEALIAEVTGNAKIKVFTGTTVKTIEGAPGNYSLTLSSGDTMEIGSVVLATGWVPGDAHYLAPLGYGKIKDVVTTAEFETMASHDGVKRPSDGKAPQTVCFICDPGKFLEGVSYEAGAVCEPVEDLPEETKAEGEEGEEEEDSFVYPDKESAKHLAYSSELTSLVALKQANYVADDGGVAYILYDHMMVPGINEQYYKAAQDNPAVMLSKADVVEVKENGGSVVVVAKNTLLGDSVEIVADMVVLPTAMVPTTAADPTINLVYRQGPAFPDLELFDGFADSNYVCFPYETRRTGVYAAGAVRQPMGLGLAREDAAGAVLKAVQCIESANHGVAVHPRSGDLSYPVFNFMRCTQCKRCTEECPFGALDDDEKGTPKPNPSRCRRCGTCMGACPERVISFDNYNIDQIGSAIKEVKVPDTLEEGGPRIIVLACENDAYPALDMAAMRGKGWSPYVRFLPVRCLGSVNAIWVADAMSKGVDGVMMLGCKYGDDYQCHFMKGSELCSRRKENIAESLGRLGVEPERVEQYELSIDEYDKVPSMIADFVDNITNNFGPNPFKGY